MICDLAAQALGAVSLRRLPDRLRVRGRVPAARRRRRDLHRRGPGVRRQDPAVRRPAARAAAIVVIDDSAMFAYDHPNCYARFEDLPRRRPRRRCRCWNAWSRSWMPTAPAFIVYTSGTTGNPKGALVAHGRHLAGAYNLVEHYPLLAEREQRTVVYLPLCHILGRDIAITLPLLSRPRAALRRGASRTCRRRCSRSRRPCSSPCRGTCRSSPRRCWSPSAIRARQARGLRLRDARRPRAAPRARWDGQAERSNRVLEHVAGALAFRPILNKLGFDALELVIQRRRAAAAGDDGAVADLGRQRRARSTARPRRPGAIITGQRGPFPRPGDVGTVAPGWKVELAAHGRDPGARRHVFEATGAIRGDARGAGRGRLAADRRRRRVARRRAAPRRPRARLHRHRRRQDAVAVLHREHRAREPVHRRGRGVRPRAAST